jgi:hypothetical protein
MQTLHLQAMVGEDGKLRLEVPCGLPPGPVEVVLVIASAADEQKKLSWNDIVGVGKEIWAGEDAQEYVNRLRRE